MESNAVNISWPLVGNKKISEFLSKSVIKGEISGAYIFNGPDNLGKTRMALNFAKVLLCQDGNSFSPCGDCPSCRKFSSNDSAGDDGNIHSDLYLVRKNKDKKNVSIEQARGLIKFLSLSSFLNSYKVGIIKRADSLSEEAANAILKTLEEPKEKVVIIMITDNADKLPATIVSRSKVLNFRPVGFNVIYDYLADDLKIPRGSAKTFARISMGRPALAVKFAQDKEFREAYSVMARAFLDSCAVDVNGRLRILEEAVNKKLSGQELVAFAGRMLEVWEGAARDFLLFDLGRENLVQHEIFRDDFVKLKKRFRQADLIGFLERIKEARRYIAANVGSRAVLENLLVSV